MEGQEQIQESEKPLEVLKLNIEFELKTGVVKVSGHIGNTDLCMKIFIEAAHIVLAKNAEQDKARMQAQSKTLEVIGANLKNGTNEDAPAPKAD